jgi:putative oxidoreductase
MVAGKEAFAMQTLRKGFEHYGPAAGRTALALIFILSGLNKLADPAGTGMYIASKGLPLGTLLAVLAGAVEVAGGLSVALGVRARWGALALAGFLVPVTFLFHNPAGLEGMAAQMEVIQVLKNLAILGGLLAVASLGAGPLSLDARSAARRGERAHA